jgi:opacity protein-like surface antigen
MKKFIVTTTVAICLTAGNINAKDINHKNGFYLGANVGMSSLNTNMTYNSTLDSYGNDSYAIDILVGYRIFRNKIFYGVEASSNPYSNAITLSKTTNMNAKFKNNYNYGFSALFGYGLENNLYFFGKIGVVISKFELYGAERPTANGKNTTNGISGGVGIEYFTSKNISISGEYRYVSYNHLTIGDIKHKPTKQSFLLGIRYNF